MRSCTIENSISKTAIDSLYAKWSVVAAGYDPVCMEDNGKLYNNLIISMSETFVNYSKLLKEKKNLEACELLPTSNRKEVRVRRQIPLVNVSYALRIKAVSGTISRFIQCHSARKNNPAESLSCHLIPEVRKLSRADDINIVVIGSGLDVLGLWALSLSPLKVRLYEIDCEENCVLKKNVMVRAGILRHCSNRTKIEELTPKNDKGDKALQVCHTNGIFVQGCIDFDSTRNKKSTSEHTDQFPHYTLLSVDLRNILDIKAAFKALSIDTAQPTIVISELVLPYLGKSNATNLLKFISSDVCCREGSMLLAYEPIGSLKSPVLGENISAAQGYTTKYFGQFTDRLKIGNQNSSLSKGNETNDNLFHPIAFSCSRTQGKLRECGFDGPVDCCQVLKAIRSCDDSQAIKYPELFDEHAALNLHLQCYGIMCASSYGTNLSTFLKICPWGKTENVSLDMGYWHKACFVGSKGAEYAVSSIKSEDQEQVRHLFKDSYSEIFEEYPSVKKMVQTALKTDLSDKAPKTMGDQNLSDSTIWNWYSKAGGAFWVISEGPRLSTPLTKIIGCIGVTAHSNVGSIDILKPRTYTIHRLVVDASVRGQGIGNALLSTVQDYVTWKESNSQPVIIATTPVVMQAANQLYYSNGFEVQEEVQMGKMVMRTFYKVTDM